LNGYSSSDKTKHCNGGVILLTTRLSETRDLPDMLALDSKVWNYDNSPADLTKLTTLEQFAEYNPPGSQIVAELDGVFCGYVGMRPPTSLLSNRHVVELAIAVDSQFRGAGIGRALLEAAEKYAAGEGKRKLYLRVLSSNTGAIAFYEKCGFILQGRMVEEFFINGRYVDDLLMYKPLEAVKLPTTLD
jgi:RimJ/RimL family protein N-acetyltransferase